jgi:sugar lactone lactonase YvrE
MDARGSTVRVHTVILGLFALVVAKAPVLVTAAAFPTLISLPANFGPEGIAVGAGHTFYVGSLAAATLGQILVGDLRTGEVSELVAPSGRPALGMKYDERSDLLFVAGGVSGTGTIYDASSGDQVRLFQFQPPSLPPPAVATTFINDVVVTREAAYFTDSAGAFLYRVDLGPRGAPAEDFEEVPLPANFAATGGCPGAPGARANGIAASPNGKYLIVDHTSEGQIYRVDTATHTAVPIELVGGDLCNADGVLLDGRTLYVAQNFRNTVSVVELAPDYLSGTISSAITEPFASNAATKVPTTIAEFGNSLYVVTAGFAPPAPDFVVRLPK